MGAIAAAALGVTAGMLGGVAHADIPGADGVYTGCSIRSTGALRVIDFEAGQRCRSTELTITWNQTGLAGPVGPAGPAGTVNTTKVFGQVTEAPAGGAGRSTAVCPAGQKVIGGGFSLNPGESAYFADRRTTNTQDDTWIVDFQNPTPNALTGIAIAYCSP
ncbi:hypothetical protein [Streptomyces sp. NPDC050564]|uniref:hypothetical protein n=1 Tax=Streptomyces sp. NPDC050564 TaxID=3365631 RepID=UPI00379B8B49